jgi:hypothetical protein
MVGRRRRIVPPTRPKPATGIAQLAGSGTKLPLLLVRNGTVTWPTVPIGVLRARPLFFTVGDINKSSRANSARGRMTKGEKQILLLLAGFCHNSGWGRCR